LPIVCQLIDSKDKTVRNKTVLSRNISSSGIYFEIDELITLGTEMNVSFQLPNSKNMIHTTIRVMRIETLETEKAFGIGATFINIADKDKEEIQILVDRLDINKLLAIAIKKLASDLHLLAGQSPVLRIQGDLEILDLPKLSPDDIPKLVYSIMSKHQIKRFEQEKELDFAIQFDMHNRFRVNLHQQRGYTEATFRLINTEISSFEELKIPLVIKELAGLKDGLILIVGPTGSGKSTTIAAMVEYINHERKAVIITLERPIEYVYANEKSIIKQREIGIDTASFSTALKSTLRQDPNVIVIGELDDVETVKTAIIAAEAGHFVLASFHAPNTVQAIDRLANMFPVENRKQILFQLSNCIKGVICQLLLPSIDRRTRILATEILIATDAVRNVMRNDELIHLPTIIQTGASYKMQSMNESIKYYVDHNLVDPATANFYSKEFNKYTRG
ncbi:MAG: PilT/PilU family type 4a pilus ATPase, partial [Deltaproteobacteria bacterium]